MDESPVTGVMQVRTDNDEMLEAILEAKGTLRQFMEAFRDPLDGQTGFHLKVRFEAEEQVEHIWLTELDLESKPPTGMVANDGQIPGFVYGRRVSFEKAWVTDWMYNDNGQTMGGYTTNVLRKIRQRQVEKGLYDILRRRLKKATVH